MLKNYLINKYRKTLKDIFNKYIDLAKKDDIYSKYFGMVNHNIKLISYAFRTLVEEKINRFKDVFKKDNDSFLYVVDKELFERIKNIFENVGAILNAE